VATFSEQMRSYTLLYSKIWKQIVAMVTVPLLIIFPFILILSQYKNLSDAVIFTLIGAAMGVMILLTLYGVFKQAMVQSEIKITNVGLQIVFKRKTLFNWHQEKFISFNNLVFVSDDIDINNNREFFTQKVKGETGKMILIAPKKAPKGEIENFSLELSATVEQYNASHPGSSSPIKTGSFYRGKFAIILNWLFVGAAILSTIIKIINPSSVEWYRLLWLYVISASWLANFYIVKKKQRQEN
jgi:hypothetical protein